MTQPINDNLQVNGDVYLKADNFVSLHYGNRGRLGATPAFNPDDNSNGLWLEASNDGSESGGIFCNGNTIVLWSPGDSDTLRIYDEDNFGSSNLVPKFVINNVGDVGLPGSMGIGTLNPQAGKLELQSPWGNWVFLRQERNVDSGGGFHIHNPWGNSDQPQGDPSRNRLEIAYRTPAGQDLWGQFVLHGPSGNVGIGTANPQAKLHVNGDIIATGDIVLQNADCAEEFTVKDLEAIEPGTVMVLDEGDSLRPSTEAYDKKVAGVVSGAGDFKPGLILDKQAESTNRMPIALMGKVYCKVDANYAPIEVGDLLTTSLTAGYAMKATDPLKAFGTIIGKALRSLDTGTGLIPILVALQ